MVKVTERAKQELQRLLNENVDWPEARIRLMDRGAGELGLGIDIASPGDIMVEYQGIPVLTIDRLLASSFDGITIDVDETPDGPELVIDEAM